MTEIADMFEGLDPGQGERIVDAGIELMSAITDAYGPGQGTELWNQFGDVLGTEAKHAILMSMLQGSGGRTITLLPMSDADKQGGQKVAAIKAVRHITGMGLKEAKDAVELAWNDGRISPLKIMNTVTRTEATAHIRATGVKFR